MDDPRTKLKLSDVQVAEIKKAFAMLDTDGNGSIDASELRQLMKAITKEEPSEADLQQLLSVVDTNHDGVIEFHEFLTAMAEWMQEDLSKAGTQKKRGRQDEERTDTHKKIKGFFSQFRKPKNFDQIRYKLALQKEKAERSGMMEFSDIPMFNRSKSDPKLKLEALMFLRTVVNDFQLVVTQLFTEHASQTVEALRTLAKALSVTELFPSPVERRGIAEVLVQIFEVIVRHQIPARLVRFLSYTSNPALQLEAARAIALFCPGPRIAATPEDSLLHPRQMFFKKLVISEHAIPALISLLSSPHMDVREQAAFALGAIGSYDPECRDFILASQGLTALQQQVNGASTVPLLRRVSWCMSILCGVTHPVANLPKWDAIAPCLQQLGQLLFSNDDEVLANILEAMALVLPGVPEPEVDRRLVQLLTMPHPALRLQALKPIINIIKFDDKSTHLLIRFDLLNALNTLLSDADANTRMAACDVLIYLAAVHGNVQAILDASLMPKLLELLAKDESTRWKVAKVLKYVTRGTPTQVRQVVQQDAIRIMCLSLATFKEFDKVLSHVYHFHGPSYNLELVRDVLAALQNIVNVGDMEADEDKKMNVYAIKFDLEAIDKLQSTLAVLSNLPNPAGWKNPPKEGEKSIEQRLQWLLFKLKKAHDSNTQDSASKHVSAQIVQIWKQYFPPKESGSVSLDDSVRASEMLLLKCVHNEEVRVVEVPENIEFSTLTGLLEAKYGRTVNITFKDDEDDYVTIDDQAALAKAIGFFKKKKASARTIRLHLFDAHTGTSSSARLPLRDSDSPVLKPELSTPPDSPDFKAQQNRRLSLSSSTMKNLAQPPAQLQGDTTNFQLADHEELRRLQKSATFEGLEKSTHFTRGELEQLLEHWAKQSADGKLTRDQFAQGLLQLGIGDQLMVEQTFAAFDENKDGAINFREFVCGLSVILRGTVEERLKFMFNSYDADGNGYLDPSEVFNIFKASLSAKGKHVSGEEMRAMVQKLFAEVDQDKDGRLSYEEFKKGVEAQQILVSLFVHYPTPTQS